MSNAGSPHTARRRTARSRITFPLTAARAAVPVAVAAAVALTLAGLAAPAAVGHPTGSPTRLGSTDDRF